MDEEEQDEETPTPTPTLADLWETIEELEQEIEDGR